MSNLLDHLSKYTDWIPSAFNLLTLTSDLLRSKYKNFLRVEMAGVEYYTTSKTKTPRSSAPILSNEIQSR